MIDQSLTLDPELKNSLTASRTVASPSPTSAMGLEAAVDDEPAYFCPRLVSDVNILRDVSLAFASPAPAEKDHAGATCQ